MVYGLWFIEGGGGRAVACYPAGIPAHSRWSAQRHHRRTWGERISIPKGLQPFIGSHEYPETIGNLRDKPCHPSAYREASPRRLLSLRDKGVIRLPTPNSSITTPRESNSPGVGFHRTDGARRMTASQRSGSTSQPGSKRLLVHSRGYRGSSSRLPQRSTPSAKCSMLLPASSSWNPRKLANSLHSRPVPGPQRHTTSSSFDDS